MEGDVQRSRRSTFYLKYYLRIDLSSLTMENLFYF